MDRNVTESTRYLVPIGRLLFSAIFVMASLGHFSAQTVAYAAHSGVPMANLLVPVSGVLALLGGLSVLLGLRARIGALLLLVFLIPVTFMMHAFWNVSDPMMRMMQQTMFMKNVALLGGALLVAHYGSGPFSLDAVLSRRGLGVPQPTTA